MSDTTRWRTLGITPIDTDPDSDTLAISLQSEGKEYAVVVSGPKGMLSNEIVSSLRAAAAIVLAACGGDLSQVGAAEVTEADDAKFNTGNQRAN